MKLTNRMKHPWTQLDDGNGQDARATVARASCPLPYRIVFLCMMSSLTAAAFYDDTVGDKQLAYRYLDQVQKEVGLAMYDSTSELLVMQLALTLGNLDKDRLTSAGFIQHVRQVEKLKDRFYTKRKLTSDDIVAYLLPYRIRQEHTSKPAWLTTLAQKFQPLTATATTADEAAKAVLALTVAHVELLEPALSYTLPQRGDLDPLTVLKGGYGSEVDCAIFGVAALRSAGVAARFVWAPALRGEVGGKAWLEYLSEAGAWIPWVPSFGATPDHAAEIRKQIGPAILFVMGRPEAPIELTASYVKTMDLIIQTTQENVVIDIFALGRDGLLAGRGGITKNERQVSVGRGSVVVSATFSDRSFALLPIECQPDQDRILIEANSGVLAISSKTATSQK